MIIEIGSRNSIDRKIINTAIIYFRRLYLKYEEWACFINRVHFNQVHPYLTIPTSIYLASKVEETITNCNRILSYFEEVCKIHKIEPIQWTVDDILRCENILLEELDYSLLIFQPFRPLRHFLSLFHLEDFLQPCTFPFLFICNL